MRIVKHGKHGRYGIDFKSMMRLTMIRNVVKNNMKIFTSHLQQGNERAQQEQEHHGGDGGPQDRIRNLQQQHQEETYNMTIVKDNETTTVAVVNNVLQDGTRYHPQLYRQGPKEVVSPIGSGPYFPRWQRSPVSSVKQWTLNSDQIYSPFAIGLKPILLEDPKVIMTKQVSWDDPKYPIYQNLQYSQYRLQDPAEYVGDPVSFLFYPVFDVYYDETQTKEYHRQHLAGLIHTNLFWRLYFTDILPPDIQGIICVVSNSFNQTFSYQVDGPHAQFLGHVDPTHLYQDYEEMGKEIDINSYLQRRTKPETRSYTTVPLHETFGRYQLKVYPSKITEQEFQSKQPLTYTLVVAAVFSFTVLVFVLFDTLVQRRQRFVRNKALQSGALVSSLFPEQVQNRLMKEQEVVVLNRRTKSKDTTWKVGVGGDDHSNDTDSDNGKGQIADVYNDTVSHPHLSCYIVSWLMTGFVFAWLGQTMLCHPRSWKLCIYAGLTPTPIPIKIPLSLLPPPPSSP